MRWRLKRNIKGIIESGSSKVAIEVFLSDFTRYFFKPHNFIKILLPNLIHQINLKIISSKYYKKKKVILKNSYFSDKIIPNEQINFSFRNNFFKNSPFVYSKNNDKKKIVSIIKESSIIDYNVYIDSANDVLNDIFRICEKTHRFKKEINWHYSFFDDYYWDVNPSEKIEIRPKYKKKFIDVKYVWEFNRHQFLHHLGIAYYLTGEEKYAKKFKSLIIDWIKKNPPLYGVNWVSGLEISIRLITWIFSLWFFRKSKLINNSSFFKEISKSMFQHAYYLRYFYTKNSFNHTVGELFGVYFFSKSFDSSIVLKKWENKFFKKFKSQIFLQTRSDGVNIEQSINYHRFVLEFFTLFLILNKNGLEEKYIKRIEKMFTFLLYTIKPNEKYPAIGDGYDDGSILPLNYNQGNKYKDLINLGSLIYRRGDLKYISKDFSIISLLFFGYNGYLTFKDIQIERPTENFKLFERSGFITLRNSWSSKSNYLFLDFGKFGPLHAPHSHSDITNIILSVKGKDILIDSGTYSYNSWAIRSLFRSSKSHNIVSINSNNQAQILSWFAWKKKPKIKKYIKKKANKFNFSCYHNGYANFIVYRKVIIQEHMKDLIIIDRVFPRKNVKKQSSNLIESYFHFGNNKIELKANKLYINHNVEMEFSSNKEFELSLIDTYYSTEYNVKIPNKTLKIQIIFPVGKNEKLLQIITKIKID